MTTIGPALTAEEWTDWVAKGAIQLLQPHQIAAKHLHEQSFGFTWGDIELLEGVNEHELGCALSYGEELPCDCRGAGIRQALDDLAHRIEALLPPEEESTFTLKASDG